MDEHEPALGGGAEPAAETVSAADLLAALVAVELCGVPRAAPRSAAAARVERGRASRATSAAAAPAREVDGPPARPSAPGLAELLEPGDLPVSRDLELSELRELTRRIDGAPTRRAGARA
jgi:hypothetical protein